MKITKEYLAKVIREVLKEQVEDENDLNPVFNKVVNSIIKNGKRITIKLGNGEPLSDEAWKVNNSVYRKNLEDGSEYIINKAMGLIIKKTSSGEVEIKNGTIEDLKNLAYNPFQ